MIQDLLADAVRWGAMGFEFAGLVTIVLVSVVATARFLRQVAASDWSAPLSAYRANIGRGVLLGLELLVAADILRTVAAPSTFGSLGLLAAIVFIRTFLSISLGVEIEGAWPWRRRELEDASAAAHASLPQTAPPRRIPAQDRAGWTLILGKMAGPTMRAGSESGFDGSENCGCDSLRKMLCYVR